VTSVGGPRSVVDKVLIIGIVRVVDGRPARVRDGPARIQTPMSLP
jgi:hypothetical protein